MSKMENYEINHRSIGRRTFLALATLGLLSLVEGCSTASDAPALPSEISPSPPATSTLTPSVQTENPATLYTLADFRPRPTIIEGFKVYNTLSSEIDLASWRLRVDGLVSRPLEFTIQDILSFPPIVETKDFVCGSYWDVKNVRWQGIRPNVLLEAAGVAAEAKSVKIYSLDGKSVTRLSLGFAQGRGVLLAYGANDAPLAKDQGYPLRLVIPLMIGVLSTKWINRIELVAEEHRDIFEVRDDLLRQGTRPE